MCMFGKNKNYTESTPPHVVNYKDCFIIIRNAPCLECKQCGEKYYTDEATEKIERIVETAQKLMQEISVEDYKTAA
ncbi:MAG: YgiT-type zinc finger protein [Ruminococcus sp.]|nr:YgiT-type zinc finger protein [Ruminococcus sp.]